MFDVRIDYPLPVILDDKIVCVETSVTLEIEPIDRGDTDWHITNIWLDGRKLHDNGMLDPKNAEHKVPRKDPLWREINAYAHKHAVFAIETKWDDWVSSRAERIADAKRA
jgi:hypothetical protein